MTMLFFMSGIFFSLSDLSAEAQLYLMFNPVLHVIEGYRAILLHGTVPDLVPLAWVALASTLMLASAALLFLVFDRTYPRIIN